MIKTFKNKATEALFNGAQVSKFVNFESAARRKLAMVNAATTLNDLKVPPRNKLEALKGDRKGQHSIRINDQFRLCFKWKEGDAYDVEITDYH
jgi:proteic killer suppression protein